jgi:hypothetical protein
VGRSAKNDAGAQMERHENADEMGRRFWREEDQWQEQRRHKDADDNCHLEVATDEVREGESHATNDRTGVRAGPQRGRKPERRGQSHASESPVPGEGRSPNGPARRRTLGATQDLALNMDLPSVMQAGEMERRKNADEI